MAIQLAHEIRPVAGITFIPLPPANPAAGADSDR